MSSGADISTLCREFTDALTQVLAEVAVSARLAGAASQGLVLQLRSTPNTANMHIL